MTKWGDAVQAPLDERFAELRRLVDEEIAHARRETVGELSRALARMRAAQSETEWNTAVLESGRVFSGDAAALELLGSFAALTAPSAAPRAEDVSARRFAKVRVAEMQLYQSAAVKSGRAARDLYGALKAEIDSARAAFREKFAGSADYLHQELVRVLAGDDASLLGPAYPGPLV